MPPFPPVDQQLELLLRGTAQTETVSDLRKKLEKSHATGKPLRVKYGIDPTGFDVHLGHTVPLRKLKQFQALGHTAVLIIGKATALVGDPSGRDASRTGLDETQIAKNAESYLQQIAKVIDVSQAEIRPNSDWFSNWGFADVLKLLGKTTVQRLLERDDFSKRFKADPSVPIYLHECLYPLMQGWDSVEIHADVELGGTEQLFNLMVGRNLQRDAGQEPQVCMTMPILRGTFGIKKMGKTDGNYIGLCESAQSMFAKTLGIPDNIMQEWYELLTDFSMAEITEQMLKHPLETKKLLASLIVCEYHGKNEADRVLLDWKRQHNEKSDQLEVETLYINQNLIINSSISILVLLTEIRFCASKAEARRKITEGAVNYGPDRVKVKSFDQQLLYYPDLIIRMGSKKIAKIRVKESGQ